MSSKSLLIRDAIIGLLTTLPVAGVATTSVYKDWNYAIKPSDIPALVIEMGDELEPHFSAIGVYDNALQIKVSVIGGGDDAAAQVDPVLTESYRRIMTDYTLGGLALTITKGATTRLRDVLEKPVLITEITYLVEYRTDRASLEN